MRASVAPDVGADGDWTEAGVFEVAPGVYRIPLPLPNDGLRAVNVYVLDSDDGLLLIDSGWGIAEAWTSLETALRTLDRGMRDIRRFLITHVHRDHYTQAVFVRRRFGTRVSLGADERPTLDLLLHAFPPLVQQVTLLRLHGANVLADEVQAAYAARNPVEEGWELPDDWLAAHDTVTHGTRTLQVVATPGHTRGHVIFRDDATRLLFAGDHVLPTITPSVGLESALSPDPLGDFLRSLALVRTQHDARLLPAHGPVMPSVHARVDELLMHHDVRLREVEEAVVHGATTAADVALRLRWTRRRYCLGDLDVFNRMLAVSETVAHLDLLVAQGRLRSEVSAKRREYGPW